MYYKYYKLITKARQSSYKGPGDHDIKYLSIDILTRCELIYSKVKQIL